MRNGSNGHTNFNGLAKFQERDSSIVHPRIVTLIRSGTKPRRILRLLLNKRNSPSYEHVLTAVTQCVKLDTGCVRKVYTQSGQPVMTLADFFGEEEVFFAYGTERMSPEDFKLETDEMKIVQQSRKTLRNGSARNGPKPKMPTKNSVNLHNVAAYDGMDEPLQHESGIDPSSLPEVIQNKYHLGPIIGDGNFAIVLKIKQKFDAHNFALKIIDKSKCKGKEHYIDAEVRVMKKLQHPHIMSLILDVDTRENMFLVLEYISGKLTATFTFNYVRNDMFISIEHYELCFSLLYIGGDLFDAITRVTRFSESQSRTMIRHLASAMAYIHSLGIVHRDIKPENLLVELDANGTVTELKLADFGLACEVMAPLSAVCGTPTYVAPEILMETGYGLKVNLICIPPVIKI